MPERIQTRIQAGFERARTPLRGFATTSLQNLSIINTATHSWTETDFGENPVD